MPYLDLLDRNEPNNVDSSQASTILNPADNPILGGKKRRSKGKKVKKTVRKTHGKKHNKKHSKKSRKLSKSLSSWIMHVKKFAKDHKIKYPEALKHPKCKASYKKH